MVRFVTVVAAAAFFGLAPQASAQVAGYLGAQYSRADLDAFGIDIGKTDFYTLEGALALHSDTVGGAADLRVSYAKTGPIHDTYGSGTAHLNARIGDLAIIGAFGGG